MKSPDTTQEFATRAGTKRSTKLLGFAYTPYVARGPLGLAPWTLFHQSTESMTNGGSRSVGWKPYETSSQDVDGSWRSLPKHSVMAIHRGRAAGVFE